MSEGSIEKSVSGVIENALPLTDPEPPPNVADPAGAPGISVDGYWKQNTTYRAAIARMTTVCERPLSVAIFLAIVTILIRIPFMSSQIFHTDSLGYVSGAFYTWTAHPPGFIGYTVLGRLVNYLFDDINRSFVVLGIAGSALSVSMVYLLGVEMLGFKRGLSAALLMMTSVDAFYFSEVALSYSLEGGMATTVAYFAWKSIRTGKWQWFLFCTITLALGGSVRQTTLAFLLPLWIYAGWSSRLGVRQLIVCSAVLTIVVSAWMYPNAHFVSKYWEKGERGFLSSVYNLQIVMRQWYDTSLLIEKPEYTEKVEKFHWPFVEVVVASKNYFFPPADSAPIEIRRASNINALKVILYQICKLLFYMAYALGLAAFPLLLVAAGRKYSSNLGGPTAVFLGFWLAPALLFFIFGHFGSWGYLLLLLGGLVLIASNYLANFIQARVNSTQVFNIAMIVSILVICSANLVGFLLLKPLPHSSDRNKLLNVAIFQYSAKAIEFGYATARSAVFHKDYRQLPYDCVSDDCLVELFPEAFGFDPATPLMKPGR